MQTIQQLALLLALTFGVTFPHTAHAEDIVVVVSTDSGIDRLSRTEVTNIFLGRYKKLPSGQTAQPIDTGTLKEQFYARLVNKPLAEINAYWARLVFSGATTPPIAASTEQVAMTIVTEQAAGYIAYVERSKVGKQLRIVFSLE